MADELPINERITVPGGALRVEAARAGGPGGQHVNTTETKIHLFLNLEASTLHPAVLRRIRDARGGDISRAGELRVTCAASRSRHANLEEARARLAALIRAHLVPPKRRKKTRPTRASKERRVSGKKKRGQVKAGRRRVNRDD
ncbi:MAG: aminoacyl-tRNA hydrolase [Proteobacteria bacterium]|nr:aminoacyl-tRNA hydrolase [Pseudomonadota bacterium]